MYPIAAPALGAFLLILQIILMLSVGLHRARTKIGVGVGGDQHLERKVRRHGNLAENAAIFVVVLAFAEMLGATTEVAAGFAAVFALGRLSHALGFMSLSGSHDPGGNPVFVAARAFGAFATALSGVGLGGYTLFLIYSSMP